MEDEAHLATDPVVPSVTVDAEIEHQVTEPTRSTDNSTSSGGQPEAAAVGNTELEVADAVVNESSGNGDKDEPHDGRDEAEMDAPFDEGQDTHQGESVDETQDEKQSGTAGEILADDEMKSTEEEGKEDNLGKTEDGVDDSGMHDEDGKAEPNSDKPGVTEVGSNLSCDGPTDPITETVEEVKDDGMVEKSSTVQVNETLSREGSPKEEAPLPVDGGTPEMEESPRYEDIMEEEEPLLSREELLEAYQAGVTEREQLLSHNTRLQHKLAEYFKKKKSDEQRQEMDKNVTDQEQRYLKYMCNLEELQNQEAVERESFYLHLEEVKERKHERLEMVQHEHEHFTEIKRTVATDAISSRSGKPLAPKEVELYISNELKKEEEVKAVRLENIKLKNRLKKREQQLKAKEELAEGLHLIDFEQLKIENQTYNEKIEERNEELLKLRKKITSTVQVLTHVKEKLQFVQAENQVQKTALKDVEAHVAQKRDLLSRTKKARDSLRIDNQKLRQKCGLLGNKALLRDFEERKDEGENLRTKLEWLKRQHAELILKSAGVKKKIEETRDTRS